jgi:hypothetical protein
MRQVLFNTLCEGRDAVLRERLLGASMRVSFCDRRPVAAREPGR